MSQRPLRGRFACDVWGPVVRKPLKIWFTCHWVGRHGPPIFRSESPSIFMTRSSDALRSTLEGLVEPICRAHGVELVDVCHQRERAGAVVRVIIDRSRADADDGSAVSLEDCTAVSRDVSTAFDVHEDVLPSGNYRLEVSSPGLERPLVKLADFKRFSGREVKVRTHTPIGRRRKFHGKLLGVADREIEIEDAGEVLRIPHDDIAKANLVYRFNS